MSLLLIEQSKVLVLVVYSLWRLTTRRDVCAACGSATLVPPDTPVGRRTLQADQAAG